MPAPSVDPEIEQLVGKFARLVRAVAAKVGEPDGRPIEDGVERQVFEHLSRQLDAAPSVDHASTLYRHSVRETVRLLGLQSGTPPAAHMDAITWDQLAAGELSRQDRERSLEHARSCADCARVWHGVSTLKEEAEARKLISASTGRPWWLWPMVLVAVAVLLMLAVTAFFATLQTDAG